jgi:hypothetical protein
VEQVEERFTEGSSTEHGGTSWNWTHLGTVLDKLWKDKSLHQVSACMVKLGFENAVIGTMNGTYQQFFMVLMGEISCGF